MTGTVTPCWGRSGQAVVAYLAGEHVSLKATADGLLDAAKVASGALIGLIGGKVLG